MPPLPERPPTPDSVQPRLLMSVRIPSPASRQAAQEAIRAVTTAMTNDAKGNITNSTTIKVIAKRMKAMGAATKRVMTPTPSRRILDPARVTLLMISKDPGIRAASSLVLGEGQGPNEVGSLIELGVL